MREVSKRKISANIDIWVLVEAEKLCKKMGFRSFSLFVEYSIKSMIKDPTVLVKNAMLDSQREFNFYRELLIALEEVGQSQEERFPRTPSKEEITP